VFVNAQRYAFGSCVDEFSDVLLSGTSIVQFVVQRPICMCVNQALASQLTVRLVNGPSQFQGRLEVYHSGRWGTVCDDSFSNVDARIACNSLGYG